MNRLGRIAFFIIMLNRQKRLCLQVVSDIHLETFRTEHQRLAIAQELCQPISVPHSHRFLIIAGDVCPNTNSIKVFLNNILAQSVFDHIVFVPGNHDYYDSYHGFGEKMQKMMKLNSDKVSVLQNSSVMLHPSLKVLGATLWSEVDDYTFKNRMSDSSHILVQYRVPVTPKMVRNWHAESVEYFQRELQTQVPNYKEVLVTHHVPWLRDTVSDVASAYYSDTLTKLPRQPYMAVHGHDHVFSDIVIGETRVVSNPRGYRSEELAQYKQLFSVFVPYTEH